MTLGAVGDVGVEPHHTPMAITHRLGTALNSDQIPVLEKGSPSQSEFNKRQQSREYNLGSGIKRLHGCENFTRNQILFSAKDLGAATVFQQLEFFKYEMAARV